MSTFKRVNMEHFRGHGGFVVRCRGIPALVPVNRNSAIWATITELDAGGQPFVGAAGISVRNISPRDDGEIHIWIQVDWPVDLSLGLQICVCND